MEEDNSDKEYRNNGMIKVAKRRIIDKNEENTWIR